MVNNRIFYAIEQIAIKKNNSVATSGMAGLGRNGLNARQYATGALASGVNYVSGFWEVPRGLQSAGMSTTFNLEQVFQLGQVELYEYSERQPDIEMTMSKVVDGTKPLFFMVTDPTAGNDIVARTANYKVDVAMTLYPDTKFRATGKPISICTASGMVVSQVSYTFPVDGSVTEDITLVGNDKIWGTFNAISGITAGHNGSVGGGKLLAQFPSAGQGLHDTRAPEGIPSGVFGHDGSTSDYDGGAFELAGGAARFGVIVVGSGVQRREEVDLRRSILPKDIPGCISPIVSGIDAAYVTGFGSYGPGTLAGTSQLIANANTDYIAEHIQNITISFAINREDIFEVGSKRPYAKVPAFPLEATCSIEVITAQGDMIDATSELDFGGDNTSESNTIILRTTDGLQIDLGDANRLTSVEMGGGEAGGGNMTVTYNYSSFNVFNVSHDFFQPNHRVVVFETGRSRFNIGAPSFKRSNVGI
jgi:hypothetical protein